MRVSTPITIEATAVFEKAIEGGYVCWVKELPEVVSQGGTMEEAKKNLEDACKLVFEYRRKK